MILKYKNQLPQIDTTCFIAPSADIIGKVTLKKNVNIWFGTVLRGDDNYISVGEGTNIQDNCTVHIASIYPTVIGKFVTVGHNAIVHACKVGDYCLIGMGATILNGAEIGDYSIIGAGSLVTKNTKIPSGVLALGSPARVIRELTGEEKKNLEKSALSYIGFAEEYKKEFNKEMKA